MTIIDNKTINSEINFSGLANSDDTIATWSVQTDANSYADDEFNGTYDEALAYARDIKADHPEMDIQLALIGLADDGCANYTYEIEHIG